MNKINYISKKEYLFNFLSDSELLLQERQKKEELIIKNAN